MTNRTPEQVKQHYKEYGGTPQQIKNRAARNAARAEMVKKHGKAALKGKDVHHKKKLVNGGTNAASNLAITSVKKNRGDTKR